MRKECSRACQPLLPACLGARGGAGAGFGCRREWQRLLACSSRFRPWTRFRPAFNIPESCCRKTFSSSECRHSCGESWQCTKFKSTVRPWACAVSTSSCRQDKRIGRTAERCWASLELFRRTETAGGCEEAGHLPTSRSERLRSVWGPGPRMSACPAPDPQRHSPNAPLRPRTAKREPGARRARHGTALLRCCAPAPCCSPSS